VHVRLLPLIATACGRINFDVLDPQDASFGSAMPIVELNSDGEDDDPTLTDDQLEIYFTSNRPGSADFDIWTSKRATRSEPWPSPTIAPELSTAGRERTPELAANGLTILFSRGNSSDIFIATRASRGDTWSTPILVAELSTAVDDFAAAPSPDLLSIVVSRGELGVDATTLHLAIRATVDDPWGLPLLISELDDPDREENQAWLGADEIYFTSNLIGMPQALWAAPRIGISGFGPARPIIELDVAGSESDPWVTADGRVIYFEHDDDLFVATR
jgi:hypothetical protein